MMNCTRTRYLLNALADGELGRVATRQVRSHIARCPACSVELEAIARLGAEARTWRDVAPREELRDRIGAAVGPGDESPGYAYEARWKRAASAPKGLRRNSPVIHRRVAFGRRLTIALATIVAAAVLFVALGRRVDPAYALLQRSAAAYRQLQSAHWVGWYVGPDGRRIEIDSWYARPYRSWDRRGKELEVCDGTFEWRYVEGTRSVRRRPLGRLGAEAWQRMFDLDRHLEVARRGFGVQDLGTETVDGILLRKLRLARDLADERETWWLDPKTDLVRKQVIERADERTPGGWTVIGGSTRIEYDVAPPAGLFTFTPPPGVRVVVDEPGPGTRGAGGGWLARQLGGKEPLATRSVENGKIDLVAFSRSERGDLFAVVRPVGERVWIDPMELTDADGGRYVGRHFDMGGERKEGYAVVFFPVNPRPGREGLTYRLRVFPLRMGEDPWPPEELTQPLASFEKLKPKDGPAFLDSLARDYAERDMNVNYDFLRASGLGLTAYREGRTQEALPHLEDAVRRATNPNRDDTREVYLSLSDVYARAGRRDDAHGMMEKAWQAANYDLKHLRTAMRAVEGMERLGDLETARRWARAMLNERRFMEVPTSISRVTRLYERLTGDREGARLAQAKPLEEFLRRQTVIGFGDGWNMGQAFENLGRPDLALESYVRGLETSGLLRSYRKPNPHPVNRQDAEKLIAAIRRLGGEEAVKRLTPRDAP